MEKFDKEALISASKLASFIKKNNLSIFLGSGITNLNWNDLFIDKISPRKNSYNLSDYQKLQINNNIKGDCFFYELTTKIETAKLNDNTLELIIKYFKINSFWTTNYDTNIEKSLEKQNIKINVISTENELRSYNSNLPNVYKMNGDVRHLTDSIVTQEQYEKQQERINLFSSFLEKELLTKHFLVIGYSFIDTIITRSIARLRNFFSKEKLLINEIYTIIDRKTFARNKEYYQDLELRYNIYPIVLKNYSLLPEFIMKIKDLVNSKNIYISGALNLEKNKSNSILIIQLKNFFTLLFKCDYKIFSNHGEFLGYHLGAAASEFSIESSNAFDDLVSIIPIYEKSNHIRKETIKNCRFAIFTYNSGENISLEMLEEFKIAYAEQCIIIPFAFAGSTSKFIEEFMKKSFLFPEMNCVWSTLDKINDIETATNNMDQILRFLTKDKNFKRTINNEISDYDKLYVYISEKLDPLL